MTLKLINLKEDCNQLKNKKGVLGKLPSHRERLPTY